MPADGQPRGFEETAGRFAVSFLLGIGLTLPAVYMLDLGHTAFAALAAVLSVTLLLALLSLSRQAVWIGISTILLGLMALFMLTPGRNGAWSTLKDTVSAVYLQLTGLNAALPLYALPCTLCLAALFSALAFMLCRKSAGFYPALTLCMAILIILWVTGRQNLFLYFMPAIAALVILYAINARDDISVRKVLPVAAVLVALAYLIVPSGGVTSPPLEEAAKEIRQAVFDYLFFTEPRNVFSLASEGYAPYGASQLGGKAEPDHRFVMEVHTPSAAYLRATAKDEYTGRAWRDSEGGRRYLYVSPAYLTIRDLLFDRRLPGGGYADSSIMTESIITVQMAVDSPSTLFLPQRVRSLEMLSEGMVPYFNYATEIFITRDLASGDAYRVSAPLLIAGDAGLSTFLAGCAELTDPQSASVSARYTSLPGHLEEPVYEMARRVTADCLTNYDKALAIQTYLSHYYRYTLDPVPARGNVDFVSHFLLVGKEGYCTYFASAMTVLCRMAGLPARYVEGYTAIPDAKGVAYVTGFDAHAWTEVYFDGFGWLTFDATPTRQQDSSQRTPPPPDNGDSQEHEDSADDPEPSSTQPPSPEPDDAAETPDPEENGLETPSPLPPEPDDDHDTPLPDEKEGPKLSWLIWVWLLVAVGMLAWRLYYAFPEKAAGRKGNPNSQFDAWMQAVFDIVFLKKIKKQPCETLIGFAVRLDASGALREPLTPAARVLSHIVYSTHPVRQESIALIRDTYLKIWRNMSFYSKCRFILYRTVTLRHRTDYRRLLSR
jgi:transglutaminase-like putative cysteine protease